MAGNKQFQKEVNLALILNMIRRQPGISRVEISRQLGMDRSTVTHITSPLLKLGIITETALGESTDQGGRRPIGLALNVSWGYILGLEIESGSCRWVCTDLGGVPVQRGTYDLHKGTHPRVIASAIEEIYSILSDSYKVLGISLGISGIVNPAENLVIHSHTLALEDVPLSEIAPSFDRVPVLADNDANCCAWGSLKQDYRNFIYLMPRFREISSADHLSEIDGGVGLGVVLNGSVFYGPRCAAGEFLSIYHKYGDHYQLGIPQTDLNRLYRDPRVFRDLTKDILKNLSVVVSILQPEALILGGDFLLHRQTVQDVLKEEQANWSSSLTTRECRIEFSNLGSEEVALGAAAHFLHRMFTVPSAETDLYRGIRWSSFITTEKSEK